MIRVTLCRSSKKQMDAGRMKDDPKMNAIERGQGGRGRFLVWHARLAVSGNIWLQPTKKKKRAKAQWQARALFEPMTSRVSWLIYSSRLIRPRLNWLGLIVNWFKLVQFSFNTRANICGIWFKSQFCHWNCSSPYMKRKVVQWDRIYSLEVF
jgi:hypothetical protein